MVMRADGFNPWGSGPAPVGPRPEVFREHACADVLWDCCWCSRDCEAAGFCVHIETEARRHG